jgi:hypothetical protein
MKLKVERYKHSENDTVGKLYIDGTFSCFTLEDEKREIKVKGETRIPEGTYQVKLRTVGGFHEKYLKRFGPEFHKGMLHLWNVPGFEFILIHCGNTDKDTAGCILVGDGLDTGSKNSSLVKSEAAYRKLYPQVRDALLKGNVTIEIISL